MPDFKAYLRNCIESFLLTAGFKQAVTEATTINEIGIVAGLNNGAVAPFDGYVYVQITTTIQTLQAASFIYIGGNGTSPGGLCMFGLRAVTNTNEIARYFCPCKKGQTVFYDGSGSDISLTFVPFAGAS